MEQTLDYNSPQLLKIVYSNVQVQNFVRSFSGVDGEGVREAGMKGEVHIEAYVSRNTSLYYCLGSIYIYI